jgi:Fur family transcriptional regulator, zinc uptake regulator
MAMRHDDDVIASGEETDVAAVTKRALAKAATICERRGVRLTTLRSRVLELVWQNYKRAVGAYEVLDLLREERRGAAPPTVYRALDFLIEQGLVHRLESLNSFVACRYPEVSHAPQFMICSSCGAVVELGAAHIEEAIKERVNQTGFRVNRCTIEVEGVCPNCQQSGSDNPEWN